MRLKMEFVANEMYRRLKSLGLEWADVTTAQAYSVHNIGTLVEDILAKYGRMSCGINWYFARPPVFGLEFEMDLRGSVSQIFI